METQLRRPPSRNFRTSNSRRHRQTVPRQPQPASRTRAVNSRPQRLADARNGTVLGAWASPSSLRSLAGFGTPLARHDVGQMKQASVVLDRQADSDNAERRISVRTSPQCPPG